MGQEEGEGQNEGGGRRMERGRRMMRGRMKVRGRRKVRGTLPCWQWRHPLAAARSLPPAHGPGLRGTKRSREGTVCLNRDRFNYFHYS